MNTELDTYFKEHNYSMWSSANAKDSYYDPSEEIHEDAKYSYRKLIKTDDEGTPYYEESLIDITKVTRFVQDSYFYYSIYATHFGPYFDTGHTTYEEVLPHNEELTVEHIETIRKLLNITFENI